MNWRHDELAITDRSTLTGGRIYSHIMGFYFSKIGRHDMEEIALNLMRSFIKHLPPISRVGAN